MSPAGEPRIYLAGHRGLVGSAILRALTRAGYGHVVTRAHDELDLTDQASVRAFFAGESVDLVILAAARVGGILANWERPYEFARENLAIELNVIHESFRSGVEHLVFLGSSCIYPRGAPQPLKEEYLLTGPLEETNRPYAVAKIAGVELCRSLNREYGTDYLSIMPTNLYGPGDDFDLETSHVLPAMIRKFHEAKLSLPDQGRAEDGPADPHAPVTLWGTGQPRRELLHVDDLAEATVFLMEHGRAANLPDGLINVGTGEDIAVRDLAALVQEIVGHEGDVVWDISKPDGTPRKVMDVSRMAALGWRHRIGLREGIEQTYRWYLDHEPDPGGDTATRHKEAQ